MEPENMALRKESQKAFSSAMKNIKKLIKVGKVKVPTGKSKQKERGVVLIRHVPHGFYEKQMQLFFTQFGKVTNLKLYRSNKTGRSLGYAFVEFKLKEVAAIVAETMNNYLMFTKLLQAVLVENPSPKIFLGRKIDEHTCAGALRAKKERELSNRQLTAHEATKRKIKSKVRLNTMKNKMNKLGLDVDIQVAGEAPSKINESTDHSMVSVDFSSDEEISVRIRRKSLADAVIVANKKKKVLKKRVRDPTDTPKSAKKPARPVRKSVAKRKSIA